MKITSVKIHKIESDKESPKALKAFVSITLDNCFMVHGLRVVEGKKGLFVAMPNRKGKEGKFLDVAHPITKEFKEELTNAVLSEYEK